MAHDGSKQNLESRIPADVQPDISVTLGLDYPIEITAWKSVLKVRTNGVFEEVLTDEKEVETFGKLLTYALKQYEEHYSKPFVLAGVCPDSLEDYPNDPLFDGWERRPTQPRVEGSWRGDLPMWPGFDCVGFIRWIYTNQGFDLFKGKKKTANEYLEELASEGKVQRPYKLEDVEGIAKPGDILFKCDPKTGKAKHMMMYLANGLILECAGSKTQDYDNITGEEWTEWAQATRGRRNSEDNIVGDIDRGGIQIDHISKYSDYKIAVYRPSPPKG